MLDVDSVDVYYGQLQALWRVSIDVDKGEIVALVGANGAGKSTLLKTILGFLRPRTGAVRYNGERLDTVHVNEICTKGISYVPEGRRLFYSMNVLENLLIGAYNKSSREKAKETLDWVCQLFPILKEREHQMARTLSGGEQQMLAIGRALMSRPELLLLDEASLGLAPIMCDRIYDAIDFLHGQHIAILLVEQNVRRVLQAADRGYVLETGHVRLSGKSEELLENEFVKKAYIGL